MRFVRQIAATWIWVCLSLALAQEPPQPAERSPLQQTPQAAPQQQQDAQPQQPEPALPQGGLQNAPPLTPVEQREKQIRMYDPLDKTDPSLQKDPADALPGNTRRPADAQPPTQISPQAGPLPGSVAASSQSGPANPRRQGPQVVDDSGAEIAQEYTGPAVLSRSYTLARPMVPRQVKWSYSLGLNIVFDTGLTGGMVNSDGSLANQSSLGNSISWNVNGRHFWKRDQVGLSYGGSMTQYYSNSAYSGQNHRLSLDYGHEFSRHLSLNLVETGSIESQGFALENQTVGPETSIANINLAASPTVAILDQGTRQFMSNASVTWQKSARLSVNFGGGIFVVDHTGTGLFGTTGYQAQADINYRLSRKMTVGIYYSFSDYLYTQHIEVSNTNTVGGIFSYSLSRTAQFRLRAGASRSEDEGLTTVPIDPEIALLFGRGSTIIEAYHLSIQSDISAELVKDFGRSRTANISYAKGIVPGNGVILTSVQESVTGGFSTRFFRQYGANAGVGYSTLSSTSQTVGKYATKYVTISASRTLRHGIGLNLGMDYRLFNLSDQATVHNQFRITSGITWGPGEGKLW